MVDELNSMNEFVSDIGVWQQIKHLNDKGKISSILQKDIKFLIGRLDVASPTNG